MIRKARFWCPALWDKDKKLDFALKIGWRALCERSPATLNSNGGRGGRAEARAHPFRICRKGEEIWEISEPVFFSRACDAVVQFPLGSGSYMWRYLLDKIRTYFEQNPTLTFDCRPQGGNPAQRLAA